MPDANGRIRGISVPEIPWQRTEVRGGARTDKTTSAVADEIIASAGDIELPDHLKQYKPDRSKLSGADEKQAARENSQATPETRAWKEGRRQAHINAIQQAEQG